VFQSQYIHYRDSPYQVYGPWMPRGGDYVTITADVVAANMPATGITVELWQKNSETVGDGAIIGTGLLITGAAGQYPTSFGPTSAPNAGIEELVRYVFNVPSQTALGQWVLLRMLTPVWWDKG